MKLFSLFFILLLSFYFVSPKSTYASNTYYAHIVYEETYIYSSLSEDSKLFMLPQTYYIELLSSASDSFYYARYNDIYGYVKKSSVKPIIGTPSNPFLQNITFRIFVPSGANLRSTPENLGPTNLLYSIPFLETNLLYYGTMQGEESISKKGNIWYCCKYYVNNLSYIGYVYSPLCDCLSPINSNAEIFEYLDGDLQFNAETPQISQTNKMEELSQTTQIIIIVAISLPCLLFIYLIFKPTQIAQNAENKQKVKKHRQKKKICKLKHSDYFELDDDFY